MAPATEPERLVRRRQRLVRFRQLLALGLVVAAAAVAAVYFINRRADQLAAARRPELKAPLLGLDVQQSASGLTIAKTDSGRPVFRVEARRAEKVGPGGEDELHQVRILIYADDGIHADEIAGDDFAYDEASGALHARGPLHIAVQEEPADPGAATPIFIEASDLDYNVKRGSGAIVRGITFRYGSATGNAGAVQLDSHAALARFSQGVAVRWRRAGSPDVILSGAAATLRRLPKTSPDTATLALAGDAHIVSGTQSLVADRMQFVLRRDQSLRHLEAFGHLVAVNAASGGPMRLEAAEGHADFADARQPTLQNLVLTGAVRATRATPVGNDQLAAGELAASFDADHQLTTIFARREAELTLGAQGGQRLAAPELDFYFQPAATPGPAPVKSRLDRIVAVGRAQLDAASKAAADAFAGTPGSRSPSGTAPAHAEADHFTLLLDAAQQPALALASGRVVVRQTVSGELRSSDCDQLELRFARDGDSRQAQLQQAIETGNVVLRQGDRRLAAQRLVFTPADNRAVLSGGVRAAEPAAAFTAPALTWIQRADGSSLLDASGGVTLSLQPSAASRGPSTLPGPMLNGGQPVAVTADALSWSQPPARSGGSAPAASPDPATFRGQAVFTGQVRLLQAPNLLRADRLAVDAAANTLAADGHVETDFINAAGASALPALTSPHPRSAASQPNSSLAPSKSVAISAPRLRYAAATQQALYSGGVEVHLGPATLAAPTLTVYLRAANTRAGVSPAAPAGLDHALAEGGVRIHQPGRSATASTVRYDFAQGIIQLEGGPPSILDAEQGKITGDPLTFSLTNDAIQVGSKPGTRAMGQTIAHN